MELPRLPLQLSLVHGYRLLPGSFPLMALSFVWESNIDLIVGGSIVIYEDPRFRR